MKFVPKSQINNNPALVQMMAWHWPGDKPLSEPMMVSLLTHICVTGPQWVNAVAHQQSQSWPWVPHIRTVPTFQAAAREMTQFMIIYVVEQTTAMLLHLRDLETIHLFHGYYLQAVGWKKQTTRRLISHTGIGQWPLYQDIYIYIKYKLTFPWLGLIPFVYHGFLFNIICLNLLALIWLSILNHARFCDIPSALLNVVCHMNSKSSIYQKKWTKPNVSSACRYPALLHTSPDSKVHGANMGPTWVLLAPDGPHVGPKNLVIRADIYGDDQVHVPLEPAPALTYWGWDKMAAILQTTYGHFQIHFLEWKCTNFN